MRVVINAQLDPHRSGGIAQVLLGLAHGLVELADDNDYMFVCSTASANWLAPHLCGHLRMVVNKRQTPGPARGPRTSDGFWESFEPDVLHFPYQSYTLTDVPTVFNPHDLQHVHLPELFSDDERSRREALYAPACRHAKAVVVASEWVRRDVCQYYDLPSDKVHVVEWGAPTATYERLTDVEIDKALSSLGVSPGYLLYPAQTWPHKNHARLLEALALLRRRDGLTLSLVCTGAQTEYASELKAHAERLGLSDSVRFAGRVEERTLLALYRRARAVVVPTLFEAVSFPVYEAFTEGVPVACSNVTSLPQQVGDAAILFDPHSVEEIACAIKRVVSDEALRASLIERGTARIASLNWKKTAAGYRDVYESVLGGDSAASDTPAMASDRSDPAVAPLSTVM